MSRFKLDQPFFEPGFYQQRPIIVDSDNLESPDTVTLKYEEAVARANGSSGKDLAGDLSPALQPMSAFKSHQAQINGFHGARYGDFTQQQFSQSQTRQHEDVSHMNQLAFAANQHAALAAASSSPTTYRDFPSTPTGLSLLGLQPRHGPPGTRVHLDFSSQYDLSAVIPSQPFATVYFGNVRCPAQIIKSTQNDNGSCVYTVAALAPRLDIILDQNTDVPLAIAIETEEGREVARVPATGSFTLINDHQANVHQDATSSHDTVTPTGQSPEQEESDLANNSPPSLTLRTSAATSPTTEHQSTHAAVQDGQTNGYNYAAAINAQSQAAALAQVAAEDHANAQLQAQTQDQIDAQSQQAELVASQLNQEENDQMLHAYRTSNGHAPHYGRSHSYRHTSGGYGAWTPYGYDTRPTPGYGSQRHHAISRPGLSQPLTNGTSSVPTLVRTSSLQHGGGPQAYNANGYNYGGILAHKAYLNLQGDLDNMTRSWTPEETQNRRRIVLFKKSQHGSRLDASFRPVPVNERPPHSICISCIYWAERGECYVTSVDTLSLLEQLVVAPNRFTVEEKNRIRRNLEGFKPMTVSKAKAESEEFFKVIMNFGIPKPRNIEKDIKVFPWKVLSQALMKIIGKYSASSTAGLPPAPVSVLPTPNGFNGQAFGGYGMPTPVTSSTATDPTTAMNYMQSAMIHHSTGSDGDPSPRSLSAGGVPQGWTGEASRAYSRAMSPTGTGRSASLSGPSGGMGGRIMGMPPTYDTRNGHNRGYVGYGDVSDSGHVPQQQLPMAPTNSGRWDYGTGTTSPTGYGTSMHRGG